MECKVICVVNNKGGVGKTATVAAVGPILAKRGYKVLLLDIDTQGSLTASFLADRPELLVSHAIRTRSDLPVIRLVKPNMDLAPADSRMAGIEDEMVNMVKNKTIVRDLIEPLRPMYDFVLIDCPPALGILTANALVAADVVLVPTKAEILAAYGLSALDNVCDKLQGLNAGVGIDFIFLNSYEPRLQTTAAVERFIRNDYGDKVLRTVIRKNSDIGKAAFSFDDVTSLYPNSNGAKDFAALTDELLDRIGIKKR